VACGRGQRRKWGWEEVWLGDGGARALKILEQLGRLKNAERLRRCSAIESVKRTLSGVAMSGGDSMKLRIADFGRVLQRAEDCCPSDLQYARIALAKCSSGEVRGCNRKLLTC